MKIIALSGYAGAGKDTVATLIQERLGPTSARYAFADPLRREVATAFGVHQQILTDPVLKNRPTRALALQFCSDPAFVAVFKRRLPDAGSWRDLFPRSPREIMQCWGTDYRRAQRDNYWLEAADRYAFAARASRCNAMIITDCRFGNEALWVRGEAGSVWRINRPGTGPINKHRSETHLDQWPFDQVIVNDGDLELLRKKVADLLTAREAA